MVKIKQKKNIIKIYIFPTVLSEYQNVTRNKVAILSDTYLTKIKQNSYSVNIYNYPFT